MARSRHPTPSPADVLDEDAYAEHAHQEMIRLDKQLKKMKKRNEKNAGRKVGAASLKLRKDSVLINVKRWVSLVCFYYQLY